MTPQAKFPLEFAITAQYLFGAEKGEQQSHHPDYVLIIFHANGREGFYIGLYSTYTKACTKRLYSPSTTDAFSLLNTTQGKS